MNKDLAGVSAIWRALFGVRGRRSSCLSCTSRLLVKEPPKMVLRRMMGPSLETDPVFRCCTVGELLQDCDSVSVIAVQEKCDEKGLRAASGHRNVRCRQFGRAPSRKAREGRTPGLLYLIFLTSLC